MSDELMVSGGGTVVVASDALRAQAERLDRVARELGDSADALRRVTGIVSAARLRSLGAPPAALAAEALVAGSLASISRAADRADTLSWGLGVAMAGYGYADAVTEDLLRKLSAKLGYYAGHFAPVLLLGMLALFAHSAGGAVIGGLISGLSPAQTYRLVSSWLNTHRDMLTNPATVALVRAIIGSSDDAAGGLIRLPPAVVSALGDDGLGIAGLETSAGVITALGGLVGLMPLTPVTATKTGGDTTSPPKGIADRLGRITNRDAEPYGGQIVVERYTNPDGSLRFEVYISGTMDFSLPSDSEPFDLSSNISGIAGMPTASIEAVKIAMADAGVTADTPVMLTGYSQGGLIASQLAASGEYAVAGVLVAGSPSALVEIPEDVHVVALEHTDDVVTALGGQRASAHTVLVERRLFPDGTTIPSDWAIPAHQLQYYEETAALVDAADSEMLREARAVFDAFGSGAADGVTSTYLATRTAAEE